MPIEVASWIDVFDQEKFHALDRQVMKIVFDVHNELGGLLDEKLYKCEVAARCAAVGLEPVEREVRIRVSYEDFVKDYAMDMLLCGGLMLEGKTAERLTAVHRGQTVNYLLLTGMKHSRLVNFRGERVEHEFVSTRLSPEKRRRFKVTEDGWLDLDETTRRLRAKTVEILEDWGALDVHLYRDALVHFSGGADSVSRPVEIFSGSRRVGTQTLNLLHEDVAFAVTTKHESAGAMRHQLLRLLQHTRLKYFHWINLNHDVAEFSTLER
jgi:GxxExxY protein